MKIHWIASKIDLLDDQHQVFEYKNQQVDSGWTFSGKGYTDTINDRNVGQVSESLALLLSKL